MAKAHEMPGGIDKYTKRKFTPMGGDITPKEAEAAEYMAGIHKMTEGLPDLEQVAPGTFKLVETPAARKAAAAKAKERADDAFFLRAPKRNEGAGAEAGQ
jgi:hypothetical protein